MEGKKGAFLALDRCRALDLTNEIGFLCGKILADLGVEVIKVEKPGGDPSRDIGPFYKDEPHREKSLYWFAYNANKKAITLNLETADGKTIFKKLVRTADFLIESFTPGYMESIDLGYDLLKEINPGLIMTAITPFGQNGPYRDFEGSDMVVMALGGSMYINGEPDREPLNYSFPLAYPFAGSEAAIGTMVAYSYRLVSGKGQYVDVSTHQTIISTLHNAFQWWDLARLNQKRTGARYKIWAGEPNYASRGVWPCKDGHFVFIIIAGAVGAKFNSTLVEWMEEEGFDVRLLKDIQWETVDRASVPMVYDDLLYEFILSHTKAELLEGMRKRGIMGFPVCNVKDIFEDRQLTSRGFWKGLEHPELDAVIFYPGPFCKATVSPPNVRIRPPLIGEHNETIYGNELGFSKTELGLLKSSGVI